MNGTVPAWKVGLDPTTMVFEIITDTGHTLLDRSRPELNYQDAYAVITEKTRSTTAYVIERSGEHQRFLQIRETGAIQVVASLPELPSDTISPPPAIPASAAHDSGGRSRSRSSDTQNVRVKVKVPQAVLYGASCGSLLIGFSAGVVVSIWF